MTVRDKRLFRRSSFCFLSRLMAIGKTIILALPEVASHATIFALTQSITCTSAGRVLAWHFCSMECWEKHAVSDFEVSTEGEQGGSDENKWIKELNY